MKFSCPICKASGNISENDLEHPVTRTTCPDCGTILLVNPDTGNVDAHKTPFKDHRAFKTFDNRSADGPAPLLSQRPEGTSTRDWTAAVVVAIIVLLLISAGMYFALNLDII
jgi:hypothetical protein